MVPEAMDIDRSQLVDHVRGRTVMVVGATGSGKTRLAEYLAVQLAERGENVGFVSADMGQPLVGVPTCMGLSMAEPLDQPVALWFIGDVSPRGNLLPTVVGTAKLVGRARSQGAGTIFIDTTGLVDGAAARALKYHKTLAAGVDCVLAVRRAAELDDLLSLLEGVCPTILRLLPAPEATDRSLAERKAFREDRYREHFRNADILKFEPPCSIGSTGVWEARGDVTHPPAGTVVGLLDEQGYCLGLGLIEEAGEKRQAVFTSWRDAHAVVRLQLGKVRLDRQAGFTETHTERI